MKKISFRFLGGGMKYSDALEVIERMIGAQLPLQTVCALSVRDAWQKEAERVRATQQRGGKDRVPK